MELGLPLFDDVHRFLHDKVKRLCDERLGVLAMSELEDPLSSAIESVALLGQEGLFDPALGKALEGEAPRPDLRALCVIRALLGRTSGLCDGVYGAQVQGLYPIALCGNEDQRAIHLPAMASGQTCVAVALLDGDPPLIVTAKDGGYVLHGAKTLVPLAPIAAWIVVLARHRASSSTETPRYSMFVVDARLARITPESFVSPLPVGTVSFDNLVLDADARLGGEGQGLMIAQTSLDMMRLPAAAGCLGIAKHALFDGVAVLLQRGVAGRPLREQQAALFRLGDVITQVDASFSLVQNAAFRRDTTTSRESKGTTMARQLSQDAAEAACLAVADLMGLRGLKADDPWTRFLAEVRALRLETEFLENARSVVANSLIAAVEAETKKKS
ncbi:MAG: acyl-CoA dehydrogenase [Deltaproteobacteria bacterium]|nr:acyl-CoA dehydrogenase [Deltaproteobacteria bacterium]